MAHQELDMVHVYQIKDRLTNLWIANSGIGWRYLVTQDKAQIWNRRDLAEKALKRFLKRVARAKQMKYYRGFVIENELLPRNKWTERDDVEPYVERYQLVLDKE